MRIPIYGSKLHVGIGADPASCITALPADIRRAVSEEDKAKLLTNEWAGYTLDFEDGNYAILLCDDAGGINVSTIFHEVGHTTLYVCERHGVTITSGSHEAFAYLAGWIGEQVMIRVEAWRRLHPLNTKPKRGII